MPSNDNDNDIKSIREIDGTRKKFVEQWCAEHRIAFRLFSYVVPRSTNFLLELLISIVIQSRLSQLLLYFCRSICDLEFVINDSETTLHDAFALKAAGSIKIQENNDKIVFHLFIER